MRITDRYQNLIERTGGAGANRGADKAKKTEQANQANAKAAASRVQGVLEVNVSSQAKELAAGAAKLEALKTSIKDGTFKVDAEVIASRLVGGDDE